MAKRIAVILAAGVSSRMKTAMPKVLHEVCGRAMLEYVLDACRAVGVEKIYVVVGYGAEQVKERFGGAADIEWVLQGEQKGTGHAVGCCESEIGDFEGQTFVICGDMPLIRAGILESLIKKQVESSASMVLATAVIEDPDSYGRIVRDEGGRLLGIVEDKDCDSEQLKIREINPSYYLFDNKSLFSALAKVGCDNAKGEYYITDLIGILLGEGKVVEAVTSVRPEEALGVNSREQLSEISKIMERRIQRRLMDEGVTIVDPDNTWIDNRAQVGKDTVIEPFTFIRGSVVIGCGCRIGPFVCLNGDSVVEDGKVVRAEMNYKM
ncbi:MAG: NTP transferase domain-containing protein [Phycisphaerae bacterium]|nr:NTP transferase domain-containing protein [Phycisphaerae bacterium]